MASHQEVLTSKGTLLRRSGRYVFEWNRPFDRYEYTNCDFTNNWEFTSEMKAIKFIDSFDTWMEREFYDE